MAPRPRPAYTRLDVDERRRRLLELGAGLFARHGYDELSMARIAREAGISKALLYHYFPSKQAYFMATLREKVAELAEVTEPDPSLPPIEQLTATLDAFLDWIEANGRAYRKLMHSARVAAEVRPVLDAAREATAERILAGLAPGREPSPALRAAVRGWLWFLDAVCLDWLERRELERPAVQALLVGTLLGAVSAAGDPVTLG
jgi:AcrR family transcriptional regulator